MKMRRIHGAWEVYIMRKFMDEDFMLYSPAAKKLYHDYAEDMPI